MLSKEDVEEAPEEDVAVGAGDNGFSATTNSLPEEEEAAEEAGCCCLLPASAVADGNPGTGSCSDKINYFCRHQAEVKFPHL